MQDLKTLHHCVYKLQYHLVLVTQYRRPALTAAMLQDLQVWLRAIIENRWHGELLELSGEKDHVHILMGLPPTEEPAKAVNALKTATSRRLRGTYPQECARHYCKPVFWSRSYCILSVGGAPLEVLKQYIQNQERPE
ncbi:MAG: IS200/IS605 family transposase [Candidatus Schekmanbacteria bacterium]|nr:IS200/IS605 family transposase [Candidatus Schekmanbacteria bacterium]